MQDLVDHLGCDATGGTPVPVAHAPRRIPISQIAVRGPALGMLADPSVAPSRSRVRPIDLEAAASEELVPMAHMVRREDDGPLRLVNDFESGHERGIYASTKASFPLVWEGEAQMEALIAAEVDRDVTGIGTENRRFEFLMNGAMVAYTVDVSLRLADGRELLLEIKRDERDLEDPVYRTKLAIVAEICRRCDIGFRVVLRPEIFVGDRHRRNAALVASRGFATVGPDHLRRLDAHRRESHGESTLGDLASALEPTSVVLGEAIVHALVVRRRVSIDLTRRLLPSVPVIIH